MPLLGALLGAPQGSLVLDPPSPKGSLEGGSEGGAGEPHASSVLAGAAAGAPHGSLSGLDASPNGSELSTTEEALVPSPQGSPPFVSTCGSDGASQGSEPVAGGEVAGAPHASALPWVWFT